MIEDDSVDGIPVVGQRDIAPDRPPQTGSPNGNHVARDTFVVPADENGQAALGGRLVVFGLQVRQQGERVRSLDPVALDIDGIAVDDVFLILLVDVGRLVFYQIGVAALADRAENIPHFLDPRVLGLYALERQSREREHRRDDHDHDRRVGDYIGIAVLIHSVARYLAGFKRRFRRRTLACTT